MKQFLTFNFKLLTLLYGAYQRLKMWFDPAIEGNPYIKEKEDKTFAAFGVWSRILTNFKQI